MGIGLMGKCPLILHEHIYNCFLPLNFIRVHACMHACMMYAAEIYREKNVEVLPKPRTEND
jgi:hypothetical protein